MPWWFVPLYSVADPAIQLPRDSSASVGRRPTNVIVCRDPAVSGQHCVIHCRGGALDEAPEVEDVSTNGTYVNDLKLSKGQKQTLASADVVSLTKPIGDEAPVMTRVEFRVEFREPATPPVANGSAKAIATPRTSVHSVAEELPPTAPEVSVASAAGGGGEMSFAQDLLVQEQLAKARITGQLLVLQRQLEDERQSVEHLNRDLRKLRQQVDDEKTRRQESDEARNRYVTELEALRPKAVELGELRTAHEELRQRHDSADSEMVAQRARVAQLESANEQLKLDLQRASEARQKAQERADRLEQQRAEAQRESDRANEESTRLQQDLDSERKKREEMEAQVIAAQTDADKVRAAARQTKLKLTRATQLAEQMREAGLSIASELRVRVESFEKTLTEGPADAFDEDTHRQDDTVRRSSPRRVNEAGAEHGAGATSALAVTADAAADGDSLKDVALAKDDDEEPNSLSSLFNGKRHEDRAPLAALPGQLGFLPGVGFARSSTAATIVTGDAAATLMAVLPEDGQLGAEAFGTAIGIDDEESAPTNDEAGLRMAKPVTDTPGGEDGQALQEGAFGVGHAAMAAPGGVSTAWSLEVVEVHSPAPLEQAARSSFAAPVTKRPRFA